MTDFPAHYSYTAIAVLSLPGWTERFMDDPEDGDHWYHETTDTVGHVDTDGTLSTYPPVEGDDGVTDYWNPNSSHYAFNADDYMTADPIFQD